jgi:hypothetical protein
MDGRCVLGEDIHQVMGWCIGVVVETGQVFGLGVVVETGPVLGLALRRHEVKG